MEETAAGIHTFLIADVRGYTRYTLQQGDEAAARLAGRFADLVTEAVTGRGGEVLELRGDEALAVFSSARQALHAAVDLQAALEQAMQREPELPLRVGIGLDAGEAVPVKGGYRGAALNLAARLCSLAGAGEVLVSETVVNLARRVEGLQYLERGAMELKGFDDPVTVLQVVLHEADETGQPAPVEGGPIAPTVRRLPIGGLLGSLPATGLAGREEEMERVLAAIDAVAGGDGRLLLLAGEPGAGKTRLAQEATLALRDRGFLLATGRSYESRQTVAFYPFLEALEILVSGAPPSLAAEVPRRWSYMERLLRPDSPTPFSGGEGSQEQEALFRQVAGCIRTIAAQTPVALLVDDLHWSDASSLELFQHLARTTRGDRVLVVGAYRDVEVNRSHPLGRMLRDLGREGLVERIPVRRLQRDETAALLSLTLGESEISREFVDLLYRQTEGNAFFLHETVRALAERGDIYREDGRWERREITEIEIPESVRDAIGERLARLAETTQEILREASVLGQTFAFDDLQAMSGRAEEEVDAALEEAKELALVQEMEGDSYAFNHALTQGALYAELSGRRRRRLHLAAGEALEQLPERRREARVAELARHFSEGDDPERALRYALQAGERALAVFAYADAAQHFRAAIDLARELEDQEREADALVKLGTAFQFGHDAEEQLAALERAAQIYQSLGNRSSEIQTVATIGHAHFSRGTPREGLERLQSFLDHLGEADPSAALSDLYAAQARLRWTVGDMVESEIAANRALEVARETGDERAEAWAFVWQVQSVSSLGRQEEALALLEEALPLAERADPTRSLYYLLLLAGESCLITGQLDRAREFWEQTLAVHERQQGPDAVGFDLGNMGEIHMYLGTWEEARRYVVAAAGKEATIWTAPYPDLLLAQLDLLAGDLGRAERLAKKSLAAFERNQDMQGILVSDQVLAEVELANGRSDAARGRLEPHFGREGPRRARLLRLLPVLARALLEEGQVSQSLTLLAAGVEEAESQTHRLALVDLLRVQGQALAQSGDDEAAQDRFSRALALARSMRYPYKEALALQAWARAYPADPAARQRLAEAREIFERLGAHRDVAHSS